MENVYNEDENTKEMIQCFKCGKDIPDDITEYEETRIIITSKWCDECRISENIRLGFRK